MATFTSFSTATRGGHLAKMRALIIALVAVLVWLPQGISAKADEPVVPSIPAFDPNDPAARLTPAQQVIYQAKLQRHQALQAAQEAWLRSNCPVGNCTESVPGGGGGSYPYSVSLNLAALQQTYCNWCGPATTQAVQYWMNNFDWASPQGDIAAYEGTCFPPETCGTFVYRNRDGLNHYVSPMPPNFVYEWYQTLNGGDWYAKLQTDIGGYFMPMVVTVAPHDTDATAWLPSWPTGVNAGHYVVVDAYTGYNYSGGSVHYVDSSANCMGSTGGYSTANETMYYTILKSNPNHPSNYVIW